MIKSTEDIGYRLVKAEIRDLTPELAEEFRNLDPSPTERELNPARIRHLKTKAEAGQLVTFHWSVARLGDKRLRMNGQHSSNITSRGTLARTDRAGAWSDRTTSFYRASA